MPVYAINAYFSDHVYEHLAFHFLMLSALLMHIWPESTIWTESKYPLYKLKNIMLGTKFQLDALIL